MKVEKIINNNIVSTCDDSGMEVVVMGRGIGFKKKYGDFIDREKIEKIFRIENEEALSRFEQLLANLPLEHIQVSSAIISYAKKELNVKLNQNIYITLTDHISFAEFVRKEYAKEYSCAEKIAVMIEKEYGCRMNEEEKTYLALDLKKAAHDL